MGQDSEEELLSRLRKSRTRTNSRLSKMGEEARLRYSQKGKGKEIEEEQ
jgi:hypothetical protein